ncbi:MAG: DUF1538 family protein [Lachnospiraceae bacterium]|nr:DUF1538 family protein [Lachnospiraceae bacterium]MCI9659063.1 DUF1538 family protein [Lachnospiraceae bacterium]
MPFANGACEAVGGNILTDAFGMAAMGAMTPLVTIRTLGLISELCRDAVNQKHGPKTEAQAIVCSMNVDHFAPI